MKQLFTKMKAWYKEYCSQPDDWENMGYYERKNYTRAVVAGFSFILNLLLIPLVIIIVMSSHSCSGPSKLQKVQAQQMTAEIGLVEQYEMADQSREGDVVRPDTLVVQDAQGNEMILMKAIKDENGDMVATDVISAAVVEARFRNVAERHGKVDIAFQIRVPKEMQDEEWQLRFYPEMHIMEDTLHMERVIITGSKYRKAQLRGYQQYCWSCSYSAIYRTYMLLRQTAPSWMMPSLKVPLALPSRRPSSTTPTRYPSAAMPVGGDEETRCSKSTSAFPSPVRACGWIP